MSISWPLPGLRRFAAHDGGHQAAVVADAVDAVFGAFEEFHQEHGAKLAHLGQAAAQVVVADVVLGAGQQQRGAAARFIDDGKAQAIDRMRRLDAQLGVARAQFGPGGVELGDVFEDAEFGHRRVGQHGLGVEVGLVVDAFELGRRRGRQHARADVGKAPQFGRQQRRLHGRARRCRSFARGRRPGTSRYTPRLSGRSARCGIRGPGAQRVHGGLALL